MLFADVPVSAVDTSKPGFDMTMYQVDQLGGNSIPNREHVADSSESSVCPWKGGASYYDVVVGGDTNPGAAWYYPEPKDAAAEIKDHVAFWRGVSVEG